jgi:pimeloyl-ACP methyl ester carboxylesterase
LPALSGRVRLRNFSCLTEAHPAERFLPSGLMTERQPVVFIHGLWLHASSWGRWVDLFTAYGYAAVAPGWPGEEPTVQAARENRSARPSLGIGDVIEHFAEVTTALTARPVLIGHGLGGVLALALATEIHAAGVIAIDTAHVTEIEPPTRQAADEVGGGLSRDQFRVLYGGAVSREESDQLYDQWAVPAPEWAQQQPSAPGMLPPRSGARITNSSRGPTLSVVTGDGRLQRAAADPAGERGPLPPVSDMVFFADRGPSLIIDSRWRQVAESCLSWMDAQEL